MYNDKTGQSEMTRQGRRILRSFPQSTSPLPQYNNGGRLCNGTMPAPEKEQNGKMKWGLHSRPLAMVYSPYQQFTETYPPEKALMRGTMFKELDLPFEGKKSNGGC